MEPHHAPVTAETPPPAPMEALPEQPAKDSKYFANELDDFIRSKSLENITHLSYVQLKQRCTDFIFFVRKRKLPVTPKTAIPERDRSLLTNLHLKNSLK